MKTSSKHTAPVLVPVEEKDLRKDYALTKAETANARKKLASLHTRRKAKGAVTRVKGPFKATYFD